MDKVLSFPKNQIRVLLLENIHANASVLFSNEHFQLETINGALEEEELIHKIKDVHILGIRSKTQVTEKVLDAASKLWCIGTYCIGTNQIDIDEAAKRGVVVFNAPYSNTRSVVELALGEMLMLMRNVVTKSSDLHSGKWDKSANRAFEVRGKILGIVGYGNIGTQLSVLAEALGMKVCYYDIVEKLALGNARKCQSLAELLRISDVVSLHIDGREQNNNMISSEELSKMKPGAILLNLSRGHIVDYEALKLALLTGHIAGAGVDVYPYEPVSNEEPFKSPLQGIPNVILTPHIGGSTEEAQSNIGTFVANKVVSYINKGDTYGAVNFPEVQLPSFEGAHRMLHIHNNVPGVLAQINTIFAHYGANIQAQYLKTNEHIGYVITDLSADYNTDMIAALKAIAHTIKLRVLY